MDQLDLALSRLDRAVSRIEAAIDGRQNRYERDRQGLLQALQTARSEQASTSAVADGISSRLDGAIERLNAVLER